MEKTENKRCLIVGASHAGVNVAFALRKEGWEGEIVLMDRDPHLPYHRPPLSKKYLTEDAKTEKYALKPIVIYEQKNIQLILGKGVSSIDRTNHTLALEDGSEEAYDKLILATGGKCFVPPIKGLVEGKKIFSLRSAHDAQQILKGIQGTYSKKVIVIGGGFIGLEIAASLTQLQVQVTVLERDERILSRLTSQEVADWYQDFHER